MCETNENLDSCDSCKRLGNCRFHELHRSKFPFVSRIEFIRSKLSKFSAHVPGVCGGVRRTAAIDRPAQTPFAVSLTLQERGGAKRAHFPPHLTFRSPVSLHLLSLACRLLFFASCLPLPSLPSPCSHLSSVFRFVSSPTLSLFNSLTSPRLSPVPRRWFILVPVTTRSEESRRDK